MNPTLLHALSAITAEEQTLLSGGALQMTTEYGGADQVDGKKLLPPQQTITIRPHTRFTPFPMHTHNYVELLWQVQGQTRHIMGNGTELTLCSGELLLFAVGTCHAIAQAKQQDIAVNFIILPEFFDVALEMIGDGHLLGRFLIDTLQNQSPDVGYLHFQVAKLPPIQLLLESMVMGLVEPQYSSRRIDQTSMGLLFLHLIRHTERLAVPQGHGTHVLVLDALREVEEHYRDPNFAAIAHRRKVTPTYLSRVIKEATGQTCTQLLQLRRMDRAAQLLSHTSLTVIEISQAVGYENTSYFYRIFRRHWGCGPLEYRATHQPNI